MSLFRLRIAGYLILVFVLVLLGSETDQIVFCGGVLQLGRSGLIKGGPAIWPVLVDLGFSFNRGCWHEIYQPLFVLT